MYMSPLIIDGNLHTTPTHSSIFDPSDPASIVGKAALATAADARAAVEAAHAAWPGWAATQAADRAAVLHEMGTVLDGNLDERINLLVGENGKIRREAEWEMARLGERFRLTADLSSELERREQLPGPPKRSTLTRRPLGVVTLIVPYNWPLSILAAKLPQALLAGNTVVVKPPPTAPLAVVRTLEMVASVAPAGVINVVTGLDDEVGPPIIQHPYVRKIDFTGSVQGGRRIMAMAAENLARLTLELGGNDPAVLLEDVTLDKESLARMFVGAFATSGQVCMALKRLYVHRSRYDEVVEGLSNHLDHVVVGPGSAPESTMGPLHTEKQRDLVRAMVKDARDGGAEVRDYGTVLDEQAFNRGWFLRPTLVLNPDPNMSIVAEEQFGPALPVIAYDSESEAIQLANATPFGLCSSVWGTDVEHARQIAGDLVAGTTYINGHGPAAQDNRAPFGGVGMSGFGRQLGHQGLLEFTEAHTLTEVTA